MEYLKTFEAQTFFCEFVFYFELNLRLIHSQKLMEAIHCVEAERKKLFCLDVIF